MIKQFLPFVFPLYKALSIFKNKDDYKKYDEYLTDIDEIEYLKRIRIEEENSSEYAHYTIFMTTACNARCDYCFEKGSKKHLYRGNRSNNY